MYDYEDCHVEWATVRCAAVQKRKLSHPSLAQILEDCRASTGALKAACQQSVLKSQVK
jgi:hypothetical protein